MIMKNLVKTDFDDIYDALCECYLVEGAPNPRNFLANIKGFENGSPITDEKAMLDFINIEDSIKKSPQLANIPIEKWPAKNPRGLIYSVNCPRCHANYPQATTALGRKIEDAQADSAKYNTRITAADICTCSACHNKHRRNKETGEQKFEDRTLNTRPDVLARISPRLVTKDYKLTEDGCNIIRQLNAEFDNINIDTNNKHKVSKKALDFIQPGLDAGIIFSSHSDVYLYWKCPVCGNIYPCKIRQVCADVYYGCWDCVEHSKGSQHSISETVIANLIQEALPEAKVSKEVKIPGFHEVDIYVEYNGKKYGIEYDGIGPMKNAHILPEQIDTDIRKTNVMQSIGMQVIRIRERACYPWTNGLASIITLPGNYSASRLSIKATNELRQKLLDLIKKED